MNIIVTGASSGIGRAVCQVLDKEENTLILVARDEGRLKETEQLLSFAKTKIISCDLRNLQDIGSIFDKMKECGIKLNGMVYSAGINRDVPIKSNDIDWMNEVMETNVLGFIEMAKYFAKKKYSEDGASVVAISSMASHGCASGMCTYASSKAALNAAAKVFAREMLSRQIRVNTVLPAFVNTNMMQETIDKIGHINTKQVLGVIEPVDVAYMVEFLLSDKARYITGSEFCINAGSF